MMADVKEKGTEQAQPKPRIGRHCSVPLSFIPQGKQQ